MEQPVQSNKPPGDAFRQQKLRAWQPIMTPLKVVCIFVAIGVAFIPTGITLLRDSHNVSLKMCEISTKIFVVLVFVYLIYCLFFHFVDL